MCLSRVIINKLSWHFARELKIIHVCTSISNGNISFWYFELFKRMLNLSVSSPMLECCKSAWQDSQSQATLEVERLGLSIKWSQIFSSVDHCYPHVMQDRMCVSTSSALWIRSYLNPHSTKRYVSGYSQWHHTRTQTCPCTYKYLSMNAQISYISSHKD